MGLGRIFDKYKQKRAEGKQRDLNYEEALKAIGAHDVIALEKNLDVTFETMKANALLDAAVRSNDAAIFGKVLEKVAKNDPNITFYADYFDDANHHQESLLYHAIDLQKQAVALALLNNPKTDVTFSGVEAKSIARNKQGGRNITQAYAKSVLDLARERDMPAVTAAVIERVVQVREEELSKLKNEKAALYSGGVPKPTP